MRLKKKIISLVLAAAVAVSTVSAGSQAAPNVRLNKTSLKLKEGKSYVLKLKNKSKSAKVSWKSSREKVASVNAGGKVVAIKAGNAKITATLKGMGKTKVYTCRVKVTKPESNNVANEPETTTAPAALPTPTPIIIYVEVTPTAAPTQAPTAKPTETPTAAPTQAPTTKPTGTPTAAPTQAPTTKPTGTPTAAPTETPTAAPTKLPTAIPTEQPAELPEGNLSYQSDVTADMTKASFWIDRCHNPDEVMLDETGIEEANLKMLQKKETYMHDLLNRPDTYDAEARKKSLAAAIDSEVKKSRVNGRAFYIKGEKVTDPDAYFEALKENILGAQTETEAKVSYGLCVKRADMKMAPEAEAVGWSATDADDEFINSALNVNDPVIIEAVTADGKFYWARGINCTGWVEADRFAICEDKEQWKEMWTKSGEDILVVTSSLVTLADSNPSNATSKLELTLGTVLPLVPEDEIPENIGERGTWYNYVVYVPTRDEQGKLVKAVALISMHYNVSVGYLPFTQRNILNVAFSCLGDRYGWGGMLGAMDCSLYTRCIYKCFGFELPRNTTWQKAIPSDNIDLSAISDMADKRAAIDKCEPGTLLMFSGHITMYIGSVGDKQYVISDLGSLAETSEVSNSVNVKSMYCVAINSLDVRRRSGKTWLQEMLIAICPWKWQ